uniref:Uncharacterized protein n=1 Tax=Ceratitis capitata TaxID=7213 RepID=W8BT55_CERCA
MPPTMRWKVLMLPQLQVAQLREGVLGDVELGVAVVLLGRNIEVIQPMMLSCRKAFGVSSVTGALEAVIDKETCEQRMSATSKMLFKAIFLHLLSAGEIYFNEPLRCSYMQQLIVTNVRCELRTEYHLLEPQLNHLASR